MKIKFTLIGVAVLVGVVGVMNVKINRLTQDLEEADKYASYALYYEEMAEVNKNIADQRAKRIEELEEKYIKLEEDISSVDEDSKEWLRNRLPDDIVDLLQF